MKVQKSEIKLSVNGKDVSAYLAHPSNGGPGILLLHAWWGLNHSSSKFAIKLQSMDTPCSHLIYIKVILQKLLTKPK